MVTNENGDVEGWARQVRKGVLDLAILSHLARGPTHGYALIASLKETGLMAPEGAEATVYQALQRLAKQGLADAEWSAPEGDGRPRKIYRITDKGSTARGAMADEWHALSRSVARLLEVPA